MLYSSSKLSNKIDCMPKHLLDAKVIIFLQINKHVKFLF